jgi:RNA polymerase sigma-70 factor, ECF subfamily
VIASLARLRLGASSVDELLQRLRVQLFVADGRPAKIAAYGGQGDLGSWLRVTATRLALRQLRGQPRELAADDQRLAALSGPAADAELGHLRGLYQPQVRAALGAALAGLGAREKNLLGQHYLDGLTHAQLGALYGTHRVTVARWLDAIRQRILDQIRRALTERMRASQGDCDSILRLVQSQLDVSLHRLLADG